MGPESPNGTAGARRALAVLLALAAALGCPRSAPGQPLAQAQAQPLAQVMVAVLVYGAPQEVGSPAMRARAWPAAEVAGALRQALAARGVKAVEGAIDQALRARSERQERALLLGLTEARGLLQEGRERLSRVDLEGAEGKLQEAEARVRKVLLLPEAPALWADVLRWRGVALFELRRQREAERAFRRALALRPGSPLTEAEVRPEVVRAFRKAAAEMAGRARLRVAPGLGPASALGPGRGLPAGLVSVAVDGVAAALSLPGGAAQVEVQAGEHVVAVRAPGYVARVEVVQVEEGEGEKEIEIRLEPDRSEVAAIGLRREPGRAGQEVLCEALALDSVVSVVSVVDGGERVLVGERHHCGGGGPTVPVLARGGALAGAAGQLLSGLWQAGFVGRDRDRGQGLMAHQVVRRPRAAGRKGERASFLQRPWIWLGAAAVSAGVILGVSLWPRHDPGTAVIVDPSMFQ